MPTLSSKRTSKPEPMVRVRLTYETVVPTSRFSDNNGFEAQDAVAVLQVLKNYDSDSAATTWSFSLWDPDTSDWELSVDDVDSNGNVLLPAPKPRAPETESERKWSEKREYEVQRINTPA